MSQAGVRPTGPWRVAKEEQDAVAAATADKDAIEAPSEHAEKQAVAVKLREEEREGGEQRKREAFAAQAAKVVAEKRGPGGETLPAHVTYDPKQGFRVTIKSGGEHFRSFVSYRTCAEAEARVPQVQARVRAAAQKVLEKEKEEKEEGTTPKRGRKKETSTGTRERKDGKLLSPDPPALEATPEPPALEAAPEPPREVRLFLSCKLLLQYAHGIV